MIKKKMNNPHCTNIEYKRYDTELEELNTKIQLNHEEERERIEKKAIENIKINSKAFFKFANKTRRAQSKVGPLKSRPDYYSGPKEMARILSDQYKSVFSNPKDDYDQVTLRNRNAPTMEDILLDEDGFEEAMKCMNPWAANGPDGVSAYFYHTYAK